MSEITLYFHWSDPKALRLRLLLGAKGVPYLAEPRPLQDLETAFDLGFSQLPLLHFGERIYSAAFEDLWTLALLLPGKPLAAIPDAEWQAFCRWRGDFSALLERLVIPVQPAFAEISDDPDDLAFFRSQAERRLGQSLEALANDRYGAYQQLERQGNLRQLAKIIGKERYYLGTLSLIDLILTADFQLLRLLDGVTLPLDLQYYFQRVADHCQVALNAGIRNG
ncbi:MAG: glutathione S-transferase [Acidithiobacillus sp.]|nr:glutathione S-transferase [Acidithiobacillus sp.]